MRINRQLTVTDVKLAITRLFASQEYPLDELARLLGINSLKVPAVWLYKEEWHPSIEMPQRVPWDEAVYLEDDNWWSSEAPEDIILPEGFNGLYLVSVYATIEGGGVWETRSLYSGEVYPYPDWTQRGGGEDLQTILISTVSYLGIISPIYFYYYQYGGESPTIWELNLTLFRLTLMELPL